MARGSIVTRLLGKVEETAEGFIVKLGKKVTEPFITLEAADEHLKKYAQKRYDAVIEVQIGENRKQQWKTFKKRGIAEDWLDKNSTDVREGTYQEIKKRTFAAYVNEWKDINLISGSIDEDGNFKKKRHSPRTISGYRTIINQYLVPELGGFQIQAITLGMIKKLESTLQTREKRSGKKVETEKTKTKKRASVQTLSNKTVHNAMTLLGRILNEARLDGYLKVSPMADFEKAGFVCKEGRALKPQEAQKFLAKCFGRLKLIVLLMLQGGLRRGEVLGLKWPDIDWDGGKKGKGVIHVRRALEWLSRKNGQVAEDEDAWVFVPPKYDSFRAVDMSPMLKAELRAAYMRATDKEGLIFPSEAGTPLNPSNVYNREFLPAKNAAEIGDFDFHDLRHTFGSWKIENGGEKIISYVSKQMGHKDIATTLRVYTHLLEENRPEEAAKADLLLFEPEEDRIARKAHATILSVMEDLGVSPSDVLLVEQILRPYVKNVPAINVETAMVTELPAISNTVQ